MNKAITDGIVLMPPAFAQGLSAWARGDGTPGSDTYSGTATAAYVPADLDFGGCLEIQKTDATQKLRYMGVTPLQPGCYLRITARIKAMSGPLPTVRIAGWAGNSSGSHVSGLNETGTSVSLSSYGRIIEVSAIVGTGLRGGVDMVWQNGATYGHFGLDLTGPNGGVVRVDDIVIEDITSAFHRDMLNLVDVRDYGAVGNGSTDDRAAFVAANAAANGRKILVPSGVYYIGASLTLDARMEFEGHVSMASTSILSLTKDFDLPKYIDAFGGNEELGFKKAFQALLNNADHETLDMGGRRVTITEPLDMRAIEGTRTSFAQRRVIRNGQFYVQDGPAWSPVTVTSDASYSTSDSTLLTSVTNVANIQVGMRLVGAGVGREVYVRDVNVGAGTVRLSTPLYDALGRQSFSFVRYKYVLDFSGFDKISAFVLKDLEILCRGHASGIMLARTGVANEIKDCFINRPEYRGITSIGDGCQGLFVDGCQFITNEGGERVQDRVSIAMNANSNDLKIRNNRASQFRHFAVLGGQNCIITGNHMFQGDDVNLGTRSAGLVFTRTNVNHTVSCNYIDNCSIEWTNESSQTPVNSGGFSFSSLSVTNNVFLCGKVSSFFTFLLIRPYGTGHTIRGLTLTGNSFRAIGTTINRVEGVSESFATMNIEAARDVNIANNTFANVLNRTENPIMINHQQTTLNDTWSINFAGKLAFGGIAKNVPSVAHIERIRNASNVTRNIAPYVRREAGVNKTFVQLEWNEAVIGEVSVTARMDRI